MSLTSLCSNCPDNLDNIIYGSFDQSSFNLNKNNDSIFNMLLNGINIPLATYSFEQFNISINTVDQISYGNIGDSNNEVKLLLVIPEYDLSVSGVQFEQNLQWRFIGDTNWNNIGPIMLLTGSEANPSNIGFSTKIREIEIQNITSKDIKVKILIAI